jgi:hypothetical protein
MTHFNLYFVLVREFTAHAEHNTSHVTISCEHLSFNLSSGGIHIESNNTLATCRRDLTSQGHPNNCTDGAKGNELSICTSVYFLLYREKLYSWIKFAQVDRFHHHYLKSLSKYIAHIESWMAAKALWAGRDFSCVKYPVTQDLGFYDLIRRSALF